MRHPATAARCCACNRELLRGREYTISITNAASLAFPVSSGTNAKIGSFGATPRDQRRAQP